MAIRYGGRYSPDPARGPDGRADAGLQPPTRHRLASRPKWLTLAATPFLIGAFFQPPIGMATDLAAFGLVALAAFMTREGLAAEAAYDIRRVARRPALPRKLFGGLLAGLGLGIGAAEPGALTGAIVIGVAGLVLHSLAFGPDPMRDKAADEGEDFQLSRAARMIEEGDSHLRDMEDAIQRTGDRQLVARLAGFAATVRALFDQIRDNPGSVTAARRYLGVYLLGARDATAKFSALYARTRDPATRHGFETFLDDLENDFRSQSQKLLAGDRADLEIEIAVLRDRLAREGIRPASDRAIEGAAPVSEDARGLDDLLSPAPKPASKSR